jgi:hypothetical protein
LVSLEYKPGDVKVEKVKLMYGEEDVPVALHALRCPETKLYFSPTCIDMS